MATTTGTFNFYESFLEYMADGTIDLDDDTFIFGLATSTYAPDASADTVVADITNEVSGNGYARQTATSVLWTKSGAVLTFDCADPVWTASGGSIVARYWFLYDDTPAGPVDPLIAYGLMDDTPADKTAADGSDMSLIISASGLFTLGIAA